MALVKWDASPMVKGGRVRLNQWDAQPKPIKIDLNKPMTPKRLIKLCRIDPKNAGISEFDLWGRIDIEIERKKADGTLILAI